MAQIVIDGVLFSPVLAHALEPGDLVTDKGGLVVFRLAEASRTEDDTMRLRAVGQRHCVEYGLNLPMLRAVGARAGRGGAR